jgi:lipoprotein-anchoring transpeptidase ErfK/SrfK
VGHYKVLNKIPNAYAYTWSLQMPYWLGIYWAGSLQNGIHALPIQANGQRLWAGYLGQRVSFGCIILGTENAKTLYNWAAVGTPVDIVW